MESEVNLLRRRYLDSVQANKSMKQLLKLQKDKSRQLIVACGYKLQEKEVEIKSLHKRHVDELSLLNRELTLLHSNMMKEQKRLQMIVDDKAATIENQRAEIERLMKQNKKLQVLATVRDDDRDMDTPSSEDNSPKSSFSNKAAKIEIKPRINNNNMNPAIVLDEAVQIVPSLAKRPPPPIPAPSILPVTQKPPVPSRAGIDRKLQRSGVVPPPPPVRSVSLNPGQSPTKEDSGRESDATDIDFHQDLCGRNGADDSTAAGDEGFCSSHEDQHNNNNNNNNSQLQKSLYDSYLESVGLNTKSIVATPSRLLTNHRAVQKPSDIKFRSKLKSTTVSNLAVLEEHQVTGDGLVTTVTYWTEPYL